MLVWEPCCVKMNGLNHMKGMTKQVNLCRVVERINNFLLPSEYCVHVFFYHLSLISSFFYSAICTCRACMIKQVVLILFFNEKSAIFAYTDIPKKTLINLLGKQMRKQQFFFEITLFVLKCISLFSLNYTELLLWNCGLLIFFPLWLLCVNWHGVTVCLT